MNLDISKVKFEEAYDNRCRYCKKEIMQDSQGNWFIY